MEKRNPNKPTLECLKWVIESVGEMEFSAYNDQITSKEKIKAQLEDETFDDQQYIYTLDISVIATGLAYWWTKELLNFQTKRLAK